MIKIVIMNDKLVVLYEAVFASFEDGAKWADGVMATDSDAAHIMSEQVEQETV